jgi:hypothetical protein
MQVAVAQWDRVFLLTQRSRVRILAAPNVLVLVFFCFVFFSYFFFYIQLYYYEHVYYLICTYMYKKVTCVKKLETLTEWLCDLHVNKSHNHSVSVSNFFMSHLFFFPRQFLSSFFFFLIKGIHTLKYLMFLF